MIMKIMPVTMMRATATLYWHAQAQQRVDNITQIPRAGAGGCSIAPAQWVQAPAHKKQRRSAADATPPSTTQPSSSSSAPAVTTRTAVQTTPVAPAAETRPAELVVVEDNLSQGLNLSQERASINISDPRTLLGQGTFADTRQGTYRFPGRREATDVAFKIFRMIPDRETQEGIRRELEIGMKLRHANLLQLFGVLELATGSTAIVMELAPMRSLRQVLDNHSQASKKITFETKLRGILLWLSKGLLLRNVPTLKRGIAKPTKRNWPDFFQF